MMMKGECRTTRRFVTELFRLHHDRIKRRSPGEKAPKLEGVVWITVAAGETARGATVMEVSVRKCKAYLRIESRHGPPFTVFAGNIWEERDGFWIVEIEPDAYVVTVGFGYPADSIELGWIAGKQAGYNISGLNSQGRVIFHSTGYHEQN